MVPPPGMEDHAPGIDISLRNRQPPHYPLAAIAAHHQGTVVLDVTIDKTGQVRDVTVEQSSGFPEIDQAAVNAAEGWKYNPGMRHGKPVGGVVRTPVNFSLTPSS
ncbi:MAG TPA: energy transducer TonB [Rhodanobacteraceae bacterium]|jgi:protein TonB|nr:energy transducer TonB [Rhodanobacteraceae bacterium]